MTFHPQRNFPSIHSALPQELRERKAPSKIRKQVSMWCPNKTGRSVKRTLSEQKGFCEILERLRGRM